MNLGGLILAGGASRRMGQPKALLSWKGETFLDRLARLFASRCQSVLAVYGHDVFPLPPRTVAVRNPEAGRGQLSSLQCGLRAMEPGYDAVLWSPVDHAPVAGRTLDALLEAWLEEPNAPLVIPVSGGRRGHPCVASRAVCEELLRLPATALAKDVIRAHHEEAIFVQVDDPAVTFDVDTPEDFARLRERSG